MEEAKGTAIAILIPVYNSEKYLAGCLDSVLAQTFEHYRILLFDDGSTDGSAQICREYARSHRDKIEFIPNYGVKRWNGGARNLLLDELGRLGWNAQYVLFMDGDDVFVDNTVLSRVWDIVIENAAPDVVRLSYTKKNPDGKIITKIIKDTTPAEMARNSKVAPWTKLVRTKKLNQVKFPENTLFEDVTHHIALSDIVETVVPTDFPVIEWNRCNPHSASTEISPKRMSSAFRFVADLMDLELDKSYTQERRAVKIRDAVSNLGMDFDRIDWQRVCC